MNEHFNKVFSDFPYAIYLSIISESKFYAHNIRKTDK